MEELRQTQSVGTSIVIGSFFRFWSNSDNLIFARSQATESCNIKQSRKKTETFRFFRLRFHCVDNSDYESGPIFFFPGYKRCGDSAYYCDSYYTASSVKAGLEEEIHQHIPSKHHFSCIPPI